MALIIALFVKEFGLKPRHKWYRLKRLFYVLIGGVVILGVFAHQARFQEAKAGLLMFEWLSMLVIASAAMIAPHMAASAIVTEKENRTLSLLLLSDISVWQLLAGKLLSAICGALLTVLSVLPMFILCVSLGGIQLSQILLAFPVLLSTVVLGACLGLFLAAFLEHEVRMQGYVALASIVFFVLLPALVYLCCLLAKVPPATVKKVLVVISPGAAMYTIKLDTNLGLVGWNCLFNLLAGLALIPLTLYLLPRLHVRPEAAARFFRRLRRRLGLVPSPAKLRRRPPITGNPVTWKDLHVHYGGEQGCWRKFLLSCAGVSLLVSAIYVTAAMLPGLKIVFDWLELWHWNLGFIAALCALNYLYGTLSRAAQCCSREKRLRTLDLLLSSDISGYDVVMGKSNAISLALLPWIIGFAASSIAFMFLSLVGSAMNFTSVAILGAVLLNLACMVFAYEYIAIYISMRIEHYATATALAGFIAWYVLGNLILGLAAFVFIPFTLWLSLFAFPTAGPVIVGNYFRRRLIREFHRIAELGVRPK